MTVATVALVEGAEQLRVALSPLRKRLLERLQQPASAAQLAAELDLPRQRVNYHLRLLEQAGLIELAEQRQRRGCTERIMRASAGSFMVDPNALGGGDASDELVSIAAQTVRHVTRMRAKADEQGVRLLTFAAEAEVRLAEPGDLHRFTDVLALAVANVIAEFDSPSPGARAYRVVMGGHPQIGAS